MDKISKVAFLGLGSMGAPMARRIANAGYALTVWNRSPEKAEGFEKVAASPEDAVRGADVVVTMLSDPPAVLEVVGRIADDLNQGAVLVEASTIGPDALRQVAQLVPDGVKLIDAPVMGSIDRAAAGELNLLVGGDADAVMPLLELFGEVNRTGDVGTGAAMKIVMINAIVNGIAIIGEALQVADAFGLPEDQVKLAFETSPLAGLAARAFANDAYYQTKLAAKDVALAAEAADTPIARTVYQRLTAYPEAQNEDVGKIVEYFRATASHPASQ
jgi:3-hydroxyisobutyrate dehydrogenase-like beta-hydroxyacid dehydrogenase